MLLGSFYNQKVDVFSFAVVIWEVFMYLPITATIPGQGTPLLRVSEVYRLYYAHAQLSPG